MSSWRSSSYSPKDTKELSRAPSRSSGTLNTNTVQVASTSPAPGAYHTQISPAPYVAGSSSIYQQQSSTASSMNSSSSAHDITSSSIQQSVNGAAALTTHHTGSASRSTDTKVASTSSVVQISSEQVTDLTAEFYRNFKADFSGITSASKGILEGALGKLMDQYLLDWQIKELYPTIENWLKAHLPSIVSKAMTVHIKEKDIIKREHNSKIEEYKSTVVTLQNNLKEGKEAVEEAWAAYEKRMEEIRIMLTFTKLTERETWGAKARKVWPELEDKLPFTVKPNVGFASKPLRSSELTFTGKT